MIVMPALLNDGAILSIAYDNVSQEGGGGVVPADGSVEGIGTAGGAEVSDELYSSAIISHTTRNSAATSGPITTPAIPNTVSPPSVESSTR